MNHAGMMQSHLDPNKSKPLAGVTVVDLSRLLSGPTCTMMLADQGARVIKIEHPDTGDDTRQFLPFYHDGPNKGLSIFYFFCNRGKESIALNLKNPNDLALVKRMIAKADILVENFRPGTMEKLGMGPDDMLRVFPRLIYCSISGFGQYGDFWERPGYDTVIQAVSGLMDATGWPDGPPTRVGTSIADIAAGLYAYCAIVTALYSREKTGTGTSVDIAMLDCVFALMEHGLMDSLGVHHRPMRLGNRHPFIYPFDTFQCSNRLLAITAGNDALFEKMCVALGQPQLSANPHYKTNALRLNNNKQLKADMERILTTNTAEHWKGVLEKNGIPAELILNIDDTRKLKHLKQRGMVYKLKDGSYVPGTPLKFGYYSSLASDKPAPKLNENGDAIRKEFSK